MSLQTPRVAYAAPRLLSTFVTGTPRPKGSLDVQQVRDGAGRLTGRVRAKDSDLSTRWLRTMVLRFKGQIGSVAEPYPGPVMVSAVFWFDRDEYGAKTGGEPYPTGANIGDLDKLVRNVLDALQSKTGAGVIADDRQVVELFNTHKRWAPPGGVSGVGVEVLAALDPPGVG